MAAAGLGIDEFVDPNSGTDPGQGASRDASRHTEMKHLPGNALNMIEMYQLRERNHQLVQKAARRSGDRRGVRLDAVGLELFRQLQREVERAHFSQAAVSTRGAPKDASDERFADTRAQDIQPRRDVPPIEVRHVDAPLSEEDSAPLDADPNRPMSSVARERVALQREVLLDRCAEAHAEAMNDLAILNQAEGRTTELRGRQAADRAGGSPLRDSEVELRADGAEQFEAGARKQFSTSNARAVQLAGAVQGRRISLKQMLLDKPPRAPR